MQGFGKIRRVRGGGGPAPGPALALDSTIDGLVIIATEAGDLLMNGTHLFPLFLGGGVRIDHGLGKTIDLEHQNVGEAVAQGIAGGGVGKAFGFGGELFGQFAGFGAVEPVLIATMFPIGKVLVFDGASAELFLNNRSEERRVGKECRP